MLGDYLSDRLAFERTDRAVFVRTDGDPAPALAEWTRAGLLSEASPGCETSGRDDSHRLPRANDYYRTAV